MNDSVGHKCTYEIFFESVVILSIVEMKNPVIAYTRWSNYAGLGINWVRFFICWIYNFRFSFFERIIFLKNTKKSIIISMGSAEAAPHTAKLNMAQNEYFVP